MFEARLAKAVTLKRILDAIKDLCKEVNFSIDETGISMQSMDMSHVCLIAFELIASGFDSFSCDAPLTLGIAVENLSKLLKCADADDAITMQVANTKTDVLTLVVESDGGTRVSTMDMKLMDIDTERLAIPEQSSSVKLSLPSATYQRIMRDLSSFGDTLRITTDATGHFTTFNTSCDLGDIAVKLSESDDPNNNIRVDIKDTINSVFALRYMNTFAKASPLSATIQIEIVQCMPIRVHFDIDKHGFLEFFLAPKLDDDEDEDEEVS